MIVVRKATEAYIRGLKYIVQIFPPTPGRPDLTLYKISKEALFCTSAAPPFEN
jgi:hypothetical protein